MIPTFADVITSDWIAKVLHEGTWDNEHGSDVGRWIDDLREGDLEPRWTFPSHLQDADDQTVSDDPEFQAVLKDWLYARYSEVVAELKETNLTKLGRTLRVDEDWITGLETGTSTLGIFYGSLPLDGGDFWQNADKPLGVYLEVDIHEDDIDWVGTILARMDYVFGDDEREVRLKENRDVTVTFVETDDDVLPISSIRVSTGKRFPRPEATTAPGP